MDQTKPTPTGLTVREAAALVGARELEVRHAIAAGDLAHHKRIVVEVDDVRSWFASRPSGADS